jgi:hypothetical protein
MRTARPSLSLSLTLALLAALPARSEGLDRDSLLAEAPAVPDRGTVRLAGTGYAQKEDAGNTGAITGSLLWSPIDRLAVDVGLYLQGQGAGAQADNGPQARLRFQALRQRDAGVDLSVGVRVKKIGFFKVPNEGEPGGEVELLLLAGRRLGPVDVILNVVFGSELGGPGKDMEGKAFVGFRADERLRFGVDGILQAEFKDEVGYKTPRAPDMNFLLGPTASVLLLQDRLQLQLLVGAAKPRGAEWADTTLGGLLSVALDL